MSDRHSILVLDDEADVVKSVSDLLRLDYTVHTATRADDGLDILSKYPVHVVMTDQRMPDVSGVDFLSQVREGYPDAIRLLFTGYADVSTVIDAINKGHVYRYIHKPWDPDELQIIVRQSCERYDLQAHRRQLIDELQVRNQQLQEANRQLEHASLLRESFIRVASHELRTPLSILTGLTQLALRTGDHREDWLRRIDTAAGRLGDIVKQVTTMLAAGNFEQALELAPVQLGEFCRSAAEDVTPFVQLRQQVLDVELPGELGTVSMEPERIRNCVDHLLLNAVKFTPDGGRIRLSASRSDSVYSIEVSDTGLGIAEEDLPRLFVPFFTMSNVDHHSSGQLEFNKRGIGLGLSTVKAFVEMHGGSVAVSSRVGQGSTFTIRLPVTPPAAAGPADPSATERGWI